MEYKCNQSGGTLEATLTGNLTQDDMKVFRQLLSELSEASILRWVVDISSLGYIDSAGLGLLLRAKAAAEQKNASLSLRVPTEGKVHKMMTVSRFDQLISFE